MFALKCARTIRTITYAPKGDLTSAGHAPHNISAGMKFAKEGLGFMAPPSAMISWSVLVFWSSARSLRRQILPISQGCRPLIQQKRDLHRSAERGKMRRVTRQTVLRRIIVHSVHYPREGRKCGLLVIKGVACGNTARTAPVTQASNH